MSLSTPQHVPELVAAVQRNTTRERATRELKEAQRSVNTQNTMYEDILGEEHHMLTTSGMVDILRPDFFTTANSAILQARKPVERLHLRQRTLAVKGMMASPDVTSQTRTKRALLLADSSASKSTPLSIGHTINYKELLCQQEEQHVKSQRSLERYDALVQAAVDQQNVLKRLERF
jgi:hypothetical protein